jgi:hypothetical protein
MQNKANSQRAKSDLTTFQKRVYDENWGLHARENKPNSGQAVVRNKANFRMPEMKLNAFRAKYYGKNTGLCLRENKANPCLHGDKLASASRCRPVAGGPTAYGGRSAAKGSRRLPCQWDEKIF